MCCLRRNNFLTWPLKAQFINTVFKKCSNDREQSSGETSALQVLEGNSLEFVKMPADESRNLSLKVTRLISIHQVPN
jgi:hypothetical protein